jgi:hypothetical protein
MMNILGFWRATRSEVSTDAANDVNLGQIAPEFWLKLATPYATDRVSPPDMELSIINRDHRPLHLTRITVQSPMFGCGLYRMADDLVAAKRDKLLNDGAERDCVLDEWVEPRIILPRRPGLCRILIIFDDDAATAAAESVRVTVEHCFPGDPVREAVITIGENR